LEDGEEFHQFQSREEHIRVRALSFGVKDLDQHCDQRWPDPPEDVVEGLLGETDDEDPDAEDDLAK
jgi:hypothetical protein